VDLSRSAFYDFLTLLSKASFSPQSTDLHNALVPTPFSLSKWWILFHRPYPQELGQFVRKSQPLIFYCTISMAYGGGKARQARKSAVAYVFSPSSVWSLLRSRHNANETQLGLTRLIQRPRSDPCPMTMSNIPRERDFDRMLVSFPSLMARVRQFTVPLPSQVSLI
jgi:hypothetical protein